MTRHVVDLSHPITAGMITYPGLPGPEIETFVSREKSAEALAPGVSFHIGRINMVANTGTYLDAPFHFHGSGADTAGLDVERLLDVPAVVVDAGERTGIGASAFEGCGDLTGSAVLVRTGWSRHWGTEQYGRDAPHLTADAVALLVEAGPAVVGIDSLNIDDAESAGERPAHSILLEAGVHVIEHLTALERVPVRGARFTAVPPRVEGFGTFPVRAFAEVPQAVE